MRIKIYFGGMCNSDCRYGDISLLMEGVTLHCFLNPKSRLEDSVHWIKMCGRSHEQLKKMHFSTLSVAISITDTSLFNSPSTESVPMPYVIRR